MGRRDRTFWPCSAKLGYFHLTTGSFCYYYRWSLQKVMTNSLREISLNLVSIASIRLSRDSLGHGNINLIPGESPYHDLVYFLQAGKTCHECFSISGLKRIWDQNIPFRWKSHLTIIFRIWFNYLTKYIPLPACLGFKCNPTDQMKMLSLESESLRKQPHVSRSSSAPVNRVQECGFCFAGTLRADEAKYRLVIIIKGLLRAVLWLRSLTKLGPSYPNFQTPWKGFILLRGNMLNEA